MGQNGWGWCGGRGLGGVTGGAGLRKVGGVLGWGCGRGYGVGYWAGVGLWIGAVGRGWSYGRGYEEGAGLRGGGGAGHLLAQQVVVHLQALRLLEGLLQALVALPQLPHVVARLGQDPAFALGCGAEMLSVGFFGGPRNQAP